jgi:RNA polymerase sigma-70 factor, ECF subfamily
MIAMSQEDPFKRELLNCLPNLRAFAVSLIGQSDKADDLVQDTILKAWAAQHRFERGTNMQAWLFTILRNEYYSKMRKAGREVQDSDGFYTDQLATHPSQHGVLELQEFRVALAKLPRDQREALLLVGASGFSYEEAAKICGCKSGTIKSRVSRARAQLHRILETDPSALGPDETSATVTMRAFSS